MRFLFFQNCISPHQMPYIEALCDAAEVESVCVVAPRITYEFRATQGWPESWTRSSGKMQIVLAPSDDEVRRLFASEQETDGVALFSGISAFPEVKQWFLISLGFGHWKRGIITEAPFAKGKRWLLWLHRLHFLFTDYRYISRVQYVFAIGQDCVDYYSRWSKAWKVVPFMYCTRTVDASQFFTPSSFGQNHLKILFVGSLEARKNVGLLLDALSQARFSYSLTIVGDGEQRAQLEQKAKNLSLCASFIGPQPNEQIHRIMAEHDLLVLPSLHDGWGAVVNEAAALGTLTACSDQCGARMIADYVFGYSNPGQLALILNEVNASLSQLRSLRQERSNKALLHISPQAVAQRMLKAVL